MISEKCITYLLFQNADKSPDKVALVNKKRIVNYKDFSDLVNNYVCVLSNNGVHNKQIIGIDLNDSIEFSAVLFAAAALGITIVPLENSTPFELAQKKFTYLKVDYTISNQSFDQNVDLSLREKNDFEYPKISGNEPFIISLTSGSTSDPKPIELSQDIVLKRALTHINLYDITENDVLLASTPLHHSLAERIVIMSLIVGGTCVIMDEFKPYDWFKLINDYKITFTIADSSQLSQISQLLSSPFLPATDSLRAVVSSSSFLENHTKKELVDKMNCNLYEIYGTSESSTLTNINLKNENKISSVGRPLKCAEIIIHNPDMNGIGEILCKSDLLFNGYYNDSKLTNNAFIDNYFRTGDFGRLDEDGYLYYYGRKDDLLKVNGLNIYPFDIETSLLNLDGIKECAVFNYPDELEGNTIAAAIVLKDGSDLNIKSINDYCINTLSKLSVPRKYFIVKELPKNALGKVQKNKIFEYIIRNQMTGDNLYE